MLRCLIYWYSFLPKMKDAALAIPIETAEIEFPPIVPLFALESEFLFLRQKRPCEQCGRHSDSHQNFVTLELLTNVLTDEQRRQNVRNAICCLSQTTLSKSLLLISIFAQGFPTKKKSNLIPIQQVDNFSVRFVKTRTDIALSQHLHFTVELATNLSLESRSSIGSQHLIPHNASDQTIVP